MSVFQVVWEELKSLKAKLEENSSSSYESDWHCCICSFDAQRTIFSLALKLGTPEEVDAVANEYLNDPNNLTLDDVLVLSERVSYDTREEFIRRCFVDEYFGWQDYKTALSLLKMNQREMTQEESLCVEAWKAKERQRRIPIRKEIARYYKYKREQEVDEE